MMGGLSIWHWVLLGVVVLLLFGKGRFSDAMGDVAKGLKSFKKGMAEDDTVEPVKPAPLIEGRSAADIIAEHEAKKAAAAKNEAA
jgi:sec-independent protein translocase protein TatA